jgi:citrate lyase beta subunit
MRAYPLTIRKAAHCTHQKSARGVHHASEIARSSKRLAFGNLDFAADMGSGRTVWLSPIHGRHWCSRPDTRGSRRRSMA